MPFRKPNVRPIRVINTGLITIILIILIGSCTGNRGSREKSTAPSKIKLLIDSDANNELDDQHAIAYALLNPDIFEVLGITVNNTYHGGGIEGQYDEAVRVVKLCNRHPGIPVLKGATGTFNEIKDEIDKPDFDGYEAVDFIIEKAHSMKEETLVIAPIGKLTNIALALLKDPGIAPNIRVVWLGSNCPEPGWEYNMDNDTTALNPVIESGVRFEIAPVRQDTISGTQAVIVRRDRIRADMPGLGPVIDEPVTGREGGEFTNFGDYSVSLFSYLDPSEEYRSLYDLAAIAIIKDPSWAEQFTLRSPVFKNHNWVTGADSSHSITVWENFNKQEIIEDLFLTLINFQEGDR